jgi:hypothetical protein
MPNPVRPLVSLLVAAAAAWLVPAGAAQQPPSQKEPTFKVPPGFTAFPDLKVPMKDLPGAGQVPDDDKMFGRLTRGHPRPVPADAPLLRKVKLAQLNDGAVYLITTRKVIRIGKWTPQDCAELLRMVSDVYPVGAELADDPAEKVGWHEDRVVAFKWIERFTEARVNAGTDPPQMINLVRFYRLQAEADLILVKDQLPKAPVPPGPAGKAPPDGKSEPADFTAFPDLRVPLDKNGFADLGMALGRFARGYPRPVPVDAPLPRKVKLAQLNHCARYVGDTLKVIQIGKWTPSDLASLIQFAEVACRTAAELADDPAEKVGWYQDRVVLLKYVELFSEARVHAMSDPPQELNLARFRRLQAEADLILLKDQLPKGAPPPGPAGKAPSDGKSEPADFTAFPDLRAPVGKDGRPPDLEMVLGRPAKGYPKPIPADAPPLRQVRLARVNEGAVYVQRTREVMGIGPWTLSDSLRLMVVSTDVYKAGAELTDDPAEKAGWYEDRVVVFKDFERFTEARVQAGTDPPQDLSRTRFWRLQAEADLLEVKARKQ